MGQMASAKGHILVAGRGSLYAMSGAKGRSKRRPPFGLAREASSLLLPSLPRKSITWELAAKYEQRPQHSQRHAARTALNLRLAPLNWVNGHNSPGPIQPIDVVT